VHKKKYFLVSETSKRYNFNMQMIIMNKKNKIQKKKVTHGHERKRGCDIFLWNVVYESPLLGAIPEEKKYKFSMKLFNTIALMFCVKEKSGNFV
jgi:phosphorylcholine metabolism protein LicD